MPTQVERPCSVTNLPHQNDQHAARNSTHHKEALRLALGSILAPKRPYTPSMSRSSSGAATPAAHPETAGMAWPQLPGGESPAHIHLRPDGGPLPHNHSHPTLPTHMHPHAPQAHTPHLHPHPPHATKFGRPDLPSAAPSRPQISSSQSHPHSLPHSLPHSHPHSHSLTPPHPHPMTPSHHLPHFLAAKSPSHSTPPSGAVTPASASSPPLVAMSPALEPSAAPGTMSIPEDQPLQMLPPVIAAGDGKYPREGKEVEVSDSAVPVQVVVARPRSLPRTMTHATEGGGAASPDVAAENRGSFDGPRRERRGSEGGTPAQRTGFIKSLQSKTSAWDALIHGSFS